MRVNRVGIDEGSKEVALCCVKKKILVYIGDFVVEHDHLNIKEEDLVNKANEIFMNVNPAIFKRSWINTVLQEDDFEEEIKEFEECSGETRGKRVGRAFPSA